MKLAPATMSAFVAAVTFSVFATATPASAQTANAQTPPVVAPTDVAPAVPVTKFDLDTPVETLVADPKARAVLDTDLPGLTSHPRYDQFKSYSLTILAGFAPEKLTPERLAKVRTDLAAIN